MIHRTFLTSLFLLTIFVVLGAALVFAEDVTVTATLDNPFNCNGVDPCTLFTMFEAIINDILLPIGGVLAVMAFIYSGFLYVTAQGNTDKLKTAHNALLYTSIGTAVLLGSWVIAEVIENTINQLQA